MTMRATPFYYYGDELGMANIRFNKIGDYRDIESINMYQLVKNSGGDLSAFIEAQKFSARDNGRTPFQWNDSANAGFTNAAPWLAVNPDFKTVNAAAQEKDDNSVLNYFRAVVKLRKENEVLVYGKYTLIDRDNPDVYAYLRESGRKKMLVMLNFRNKTASTNAGLDLTNGKLLLHNYDTAPASDALRPYEARVYEV